MFQFELHLPYFALKEGRPSPDESGQKRHTDWIDLSFLESGTPNARIYGAYQTQFSLVMYGFSDWQWVVYAFEHNLFDKRFEKDPEEEIEEEDGSSSNEDPVIWDGADANLPLEDPRQYFLRVFEARIRRISRCWDHLFHHIEESIRKYVFRATTNQVNETLTISQKSHHSFTLSGEFDTKGVSRQDAKKTRDWTSRTRAVLNELHDVLASGTLKEWRTFKSYDGDMGYFDDEASYMPSSWNYVKRLLDDIKETFDSLDGIRQNLVLRHNSTRESAKDVSNRPHISEILPYISS